MAKTSKLGTPLTLVGVVAITGAIAYSFSGINALETEVTSRLEERDRLDEDVERLREEIERLESAPLVDLVSVDVYAAELEGRKDQNGKQLYNFSLWLDVPNNRKPDISKVQYWRKARDKLQTVLTGSEASNGFGVSYLGWGCFRAVDVTIVEADGRESTLDIDQCALLNAGGMRWGN